MGPEAAAEEDPVFMYHSWQRKVALTTKSVHARVTACIRALHMCVCAGNFGGLCSVLCAAPGPRASCWTPKCWVWGGRHQDQYVVSSVQVSNCCDGEVCWSQVLCEGEETARYSLAAFCSYKEKLFSSAANMHSVSSTMQKQCLSSQIVIQLPPLYLLSTACIVFSDASML